MNVVGRSQRVVGVAVMIASVLVAGLLVQWTQAPLGTDKIQVSQGGIGSLTGVQQAQVMQLRGATELLNRDHRWTSTGVFLVVDVRLESREQRFGTLDCHLHQGGAQVAPVLNDTIVMPASGFASTVPVVFERPRDGLSGATMSCTTSDLITTYAPELVFDLGIDDDRASDLVAGDPLELAEPTTEVAR